VISYLPVQTTSHGNLIWRIYYEVGDFTKLPWEHKLPPLNALKKAKWDNKNDEACGLIGMSISSDLQVSPSRN
jgi:hypothetical protein